MSIIVSLCLIFQVSKACWSISLPVQVQRMEPRNMAFFQGEVVLGADWYTHQRVGAVLPWWRRWKNGLYISQKLSISKSRYSTIEKQLGGPLILSIGASLYQQQSRQLLGLCLVMRVYSSISCGWRNAGFEALGVAHNSLAHKWGKRFGQHLVFGFVFLLFFKVT